MSDICLVHLVRKANGLTPFREFIRSYGVNSAGVPHDLLVVFKGFRKNDMREYEELLESIPHRSCFVSDDGFDITPYFYAVENFDYEYFVFLNSFSTIVCENWLVKMYRQVTGPNIGLVGATGTWESLYSAPHLGILRDFLVRAKRFSSRRHFPKFPNFHIRSNAFMASREILLRVNVPPILTKDHAHRFESGREGLTRQVLAMNKRVLVVGCNGEAYETEEWPSSSTFRQNNQINLLVADNQTNAYLLANSELRRRLSLAAWGSASEFFDEC